MKILSCGVAVIEGDTHVSHWVDQLGTLRIAEKYLAPFQRYVLDGGTVIDAGAMIGDHAVTYADWVGDRGHVMCFEPNPEAFECLTHNTQGMKSVTLHMEGLSDKTGFVNLKVSANAGASYLEDGSGSVRVLDLDSLNLSRLDFFKLDIEGFETRAIMGAKETIRRLRPVMLVEVNESALLRAGSSREDLLKLIRYLGFKVSVTDKSINWSDPQYDVLCLP